MTLVLLKALHLFAAFAWMAGLWYYPRLLIYQREIHDQEGDSNPKIDILRIMARRLMGIILMPAMMVTVISGITFAILGDYMVFGWMHGKLLCVLLLAVLSVYFAVLGKKMRNGEYPVSAKTIRLLNEIPTVILIAILFLVVVYPVL